MVDGFDEDELVSGVVLAVEVAVELATSVVLVANGLVVVETITSRIVS